MESLVNARHHIATCKLSVLTMLIGSILFLLTGCEYLNQFSKAQHYFNMAAAAENRQKFIPSDPDGAVKAVTINEIRTNYSLAHTYISKLVSNNASKLASDGLMGSALSMKALCEWRLGRYDEALITSQLALEQQRLEGGMRGRDLAVMTALPGLVKADQAYGHSISNAVKNYAEIKRLLDGAITDITNAQQAVDDYHPVQSYLQMAKVAVYRTWQVSIEEKISDTAERSSERRTLRSLAKPELDRLGSLVGKDSSPFLYWSKLLGL